MMYALESFILRTDLTLLVTFFSDMVSPLTIVILFNINTRFDNAFTHLVLCLQMRFFGPSFQSIVDEKWSTRTAYAVLPFFYDF